MTLCTGTLSAYDEAVPHPAPDARLAERFGALRDARPAVDLGAVTDVVLLVSSSRGGSSMLAEILRRHPQLLSLPGELNPYVVLAQLAGGDAEIVRAEIARELGRPLQLGERTDATRFALDTVHRLSMQWPQHDWSLADVMAAAHDVARSADACDGAAAAAAVLRRLGAADLLPAYDGSDGPPREGPPAQPVIEMAPFVGLRSWRAPTADELAHCPLVIATPRNSYRLDWLCSLFPAARVRLLHLTRNPAAAVNGLIDGWRRAGFFTTPVPGDLRIDGYSDVHPWGRQWWKYDVPLSWRSLADAPLAVVAAEQWRSAHAAVAQFCATGDVEVLRVRYEDVVGSTVQRTAVGEQVASFLALDVATTVEAVVTGTGPVMATVPPARRRWTTSRNDLAPALAEPAVWEMTAQLGYDVDEQSWI